MSKIQRSTLSSLAGGASLAAILGSTGSCAAGYAATRLSLLWFEHLSKICVVPLYRVRPQHYAEDNSEFVRQAGASSAPRLYVAKDPTVVHVAMLTLLLGISDAMAVTLPHTCGDGLVLACFACYIARGVWRQVAVLAILFTTAVHGLPGANDLVRGLSIALCIACSVMHLPWTHTVARALVSMILVWHLSYLPCSNALRAFPVTIGVPFALHTLRAQPVALLIIATVLL